MHKKEGYELLVIDKSPKEGQNLVDFGILCGTIDDVLIREHRLMQKVDNNKKVTKKGKNKEDASASSFCFIKKYSKISLKNKSRFGNISNRLLFRLILCFITVTCYQYALFILQRCFN